MAETVSELLDRLLDRNYENAAKSVLRAVGSATDSARVRKALADFEAEAERLRKAGLPLQPDNVVLRNLTGEVDAAMREAARAVDAGAEKITGAALNAAERLQTALPQAFGVPANVMAGWNVVSADALAAIVRFQDDPAWAAQLAQFAGLPTEMVNQTVLRGFAAGWNPLRTAREISKLTDALPRAQANVITRTLYLQSYRQAAAASQRANRNMITKVTRYATLDNRVCPVCAALHGTEIPIGEPVEAHYQCRCVSVVHVAGAEIPMGPTGEEWFAGLSDADQRQMLGPGAHQLYQDGKIRLGDLVGRTRDPLYGTMLTRRPLSELGGGSGTGGQGIRSMLSLFDAHARNDPGMRNAINLMDKVHGVEFKSGVKIKTTYETNLTKRAYGTFTARQNHIRIDPTQYSPEFTFVHESAHALDWVIFGGDREFYSESQIASRELSSWWQAVSNSKAVKTLLNDSYRKANETEREHIRYMIENKELFARSYQQYIATRSGDQSMLADINLIRNMKTGPGKRFFGADSYWSDRDFAPIARAFDDLFRARGWLR